MQEKDYSELISEVGEENFQSRLNMLLKQIDDFINISGYTGVVECNERILYHVLLDYYSDIYRLKKFHGIDYTKTDKIVAYTVYWLLRRKPIQFIGFSAEEKDIFVNERFACYFLMQECLLRRCDYKLEGEAVKQVDDYIEMVLYYFKYRPVNAQVIELMIESFKIGRLFHFIN